MDGFLKVDARYNEDNCCNLPILSEPLFSSLWTCQNIVLPDGEYYFSNFYQNVLVKNNKLIKVIVYIKDVTTPHAVIYYNQRNKQIFVYMTAKIALYRPIKTCIKYTVNTFGYEMCSNALRLLFYL